MKNLGKSERRGAHSSNRGQGHFDNQGHIDPDRAARLLGQTASSKNGDYAAFIETSAAEDDLAEGLAEGVVVAMTSGEGQVVDDMNRDVEEDWGGPFVVTSASREFAGGTDDSNIPEATREPFPTT